MSAGPYVARAAVAQEIERGKSVDVPVPIEETAVSHHLLLKHSMKEILMHAETRVLRNGIEITSANREGVALCLQRRQSWQDIMRGFAATIREPR
jgi:hypothetical protein